MNKKSLLPMALIGCMLTTCIPVTTVHASISAAKDTPSVSAATGSAITVAEPATNQEPTDKALEKIINTVKTKISVPKSLTEFDYYFNAESSYYAASWSLNWHDKEYKQQMSVQVDQDGNVISYSFYKNRDGYYTPEYLKSELVANAEAFIKKVAPDIYKKVKYVGSESSGINSGEYQFTFQRVENGIEMPDNSVNVGVNFETGEVVSYNTNWLRDVKIPSSEASLTKQDAMNIIGKSTKMKLSYQNVYKSDKNGDMKVEAFLVYSPDKPYISVNAKTGEVYTTQDKWINKYDTSTKEAATFEADSNAASGLTDEEIKEVESLSGLISRKDAIKAVTDNGSLLLDKNLKVVNASLYKQKDYYSEEKEAKYVWNISMSDPREVDYKSDDSYRAYANANVDAKTGKILSFDSSVKDLNTMNQKELKSVKVKYTAKQGQQIFEDFLNTQIPDKFKNSVLTDNKGSYVIAYKGEKEVYGGYNYQYDRVNEGINYSYNGIYGAVDGVTGKIYSYSYNWNDNVEFESPKNIISADKAFNCFMSNDGFHLVYEVNNLHILDDSYAKKDVYAYSGAYSKDYEIRLVYRSDISPAFISPFTGKQLNYDGEEYTENQNEFAYNDIQNTDSARHILLLADNGIGFKGGQFLPNQAITGKELSDFITLSYLYYDNGKYKLPENSSTVTRMDAAKLMIQILGYEKLANIKKIYNVDFADKDKISEDNLGYAALAQGLKLVSCNSKNEFNPTVNLTRAEAADMIIAMLSEK